MNHPAQQLVLFVGRDLDRVIGAVPIADDQRLRRAKERHARLKAAALRDGDVPPR